MFLELLHRCYLDAMYICLAEALGCTQDHHSDCSRVLKVLGINVLGKIFVGTYYCHFSVIFWRMCDFPVVSI